MSFKKARLVLEDCFDQLVDEIVGEVGSPDGEIVHSDGDTVLLQGTVGPGRDLRRAELRQHFADGFNLLGREIEECDRLLRLNILDRVNTASMRPAKSSVAILSNDP